MLDDIAKVWLESGAAHIAIWGEGQVYANWANKPSTVTESQPTYTQISSAIRLDGEVVGHLYVFGQNDRISKKRLKLDAALISSKLQIAKDTGIGTQSSNTQSGSGEVADQVRSFQLIAEKSERSLTQVQKKFDALIRLNQYDEMQQEQTLEDWLSFFRKTLLDLIPSQHIFTISQESNDDLVVECHPVRFKDAESVVEYLQHMDSIKYELVLDSASELEGMPESVRNLFYAPIYSEQDRLISIGLINRTMGKFTNSDQSLLKMISSQAQKQIERLLNQVEVLENNRIQTEMEVAYEIQNQLLPDPPPFIAGLDIYAISRPAKHVGGDFYDFFQREQNDQLIFTVGDVSGRGISSALMMGKTRQILNSKARDESISSPRDLLSQALQDLYEEFSRAQMFATVFAAFYDPETGELTYGNAGHSPVIYCSADGTIQMLEADSPPLGVLSTSLALNHTIQLNRGDCLLVATDGLSEASNNDEEQFGNDRLLELLRNMHSDGAAFIGKNLLKEIEFFSMGAHQTDDQTMVILKVE